MLRKFWKSRTGNFAIMTAVMSIPLLLAAGMSVDYSRYLSAHRHLQEIADSVSLALVTSPTKSKKAMISQAQKYVNANISNVRINKVNDITEKDLVVGADDIDVSIRGQVRTTFMGLAGYHVLEVRASSLAKRGGGNQSVEVAVVLDNTWSMSETDASGTSKIDTLKSAAGSLIDTLMTSTNPNVKMSLVPYADYVNVGVENRNQPWVSVGLDTPAVPAVCVTKDVVVNSCKTWNRKKCTRVIDGVVDVYNCNKCLEYHPPKTESRRVCSGGVSAKKWYGCVGSRKWGKTRLDDQSLTFAYPGYVETSQRCLNPIVPLTNDKNKLKAAANNMIINIGGYKPYTYIPGGMIWGVNVLSPTAPFSEGGDYDSRNKAPRKAIVLMTDGDNTRKFRPSDGRHVAFNSNGNAGAVEFRKVNEETVEICDYAKSNKIEVYTVAFMVDNSDARKMLQACATTPTAHYFNASDPTALMAAFSEIAQSLTLVRLAR